MKKLFQFIMLLTVSLFMNSCYYDAYIELPDDDVADGGVEFPSDISFASDIQPLLTIKCIVCHNGSIANPDLRDGSAYSSIVPQLVTSGDADNSAFFNKLPGNDHPIDAGFSLSANEKALVEVWIDEGAKNN